MQVCLQRYKSPFLEAIPTADNGRHESEQSLRSEFATRKPSLLFRSYRAARRPLRETVRLKETEDTLSSSEHEYDTRTKCWERLISSGGYNGVFDTVKSPDNAVVIIPLVIFTCAQIVDRNTILDGMSLDNIAAIRGAPRWQLHEVS